MRAPPPFHMHTALAQGLKALLRQLEERLALQSPLKVFPAGGMAVHLYTASRVTTDVDAEFGSRVFLPSDLVVDVRLEDGTRELLYFDTNYNATFALMHEDYLDDAIALDMGVPQIRLYVLLPLDLAVSKIARFADKTKWGQTPINLSALHNQIGVTGPKFGKDGAFRSITAVACNGPCMLQCYM